MHGYEQKSSHLREMRASHAHQWVDGLAAFRRRAANPRALTVEGKLTRMVGLALEASGCNAAVGDRCRVTSDRGAAVETEVVGFASDRLLLMPIGDVRGLAPGSSVVPSGRTGQVGVGEALLGRVLDGMGRPLDGGEPPVASERVAVSLSSQPINPLSRQPIRQPLDVGVRSINALLTVGRGQRMGLFSGSGVGKSVLLGMMTKYTDADVIVVGLIGERGREVRDFINSILGAEGMRRAVVVAAPADDPPLLRIQGAVLATTIAEYFRDQGMQVLLLMDSLTRFAQAQREISLAIGEPPATRGYPPSVFARLPQLVERAGNGGTRGGGITAFYTVLAEGDEMNDPIADASRAILDGHIVLSRKLAEQGLYPAVDVDASISRVMVDIIDANHDAAARLFRQLWSIYQQNEDLITVGAYTPGSDPRVDQAIRLRPLLLRFMSQGINQSVSFGDGVSALAKLLAENVGS